MTDPAGPDRPTSASAARFLVRGRVQGVGYRMWAEATARDLGLRGWVRNLVDGSVEAHAEGADELLDRFAAALADGPRFARVDAVERQSAETAGGDGFTVR